MFKRRFPSNSAVPRFMLSMSIMASLMLVLAVTAANAQIQDVPSWVGNLLLQNSTIAADPASH